MNQKGQALVTMLFFMVIGLTITSAATIILFVNAAAGSTTEQGETAYEAAESGIENALLRLVRDPSYSGETMAVGPGYVVIQAANGLATASATVNNSVRKIQVQTVYNNNILTVSSWKEIK